MKRILLLLLSCVAAGALVFLAKATNVTPCTAASISQSPQSRTNCQGSTVSFTVTASGSAPLYYQWRKNSNDLTNGGNISGATSQTLVITNITTSDAASYDVVVYNACGIVTSAPPAVLTVNIPPAISTQPQSQTVADAHQCPTGECGQLFGGGRQQQLRRSDQFQCRVDGGGTALSIHLKFSDQLHIQR